MTPFHNAVCDTCKLRKVKCDRDNPCGNCVDGNIQCIRTPPAIRQPRSASKRRVTDPTAAHAQKSSRRHELHVSPSPSTHSPTMSQSPSIHEAHDFICQEIHSGKNMPADRLAVLNAAMSFVNHLSQVTKPSDVSDTRSTRVIDVLEDITYPSMELLYWMLRELERKSIGPHVLDYFKHVSPKSLKDMGLALINRIGSPETLLLYSICVNSAAFKFINTVLSESSLEEVGEGMRTCAAKYLSSVKLAMARIPLLAAPSILFLQSLLCSAFIAQGTGDTMHCWAFISAACKTCEDLGLEARVKACQTETEDDEEIYYCYVWCHILDKNYSMMLGRSRPLLEYNGLDSAFSSPLNKCMSSLLSTYLHFVPIQAIFISELYPSKILNNESLLSRVEHVVQDLLERLKCVYARITELHGPSDSWGGLHISSELNTIQFSYHSLRTSILRSRQICLPEKPYIDNYCLESARMAMTALRAIQEASLTITDIRSHVATLLYHPLTPFFVLFCNVVATSNGQDFETLKLVASKLDGLADLSPSIAKLQTLFKSFIELCEGLVIETRKSKSPHARTDEHVQRIEYPQDFTLTSQLGIETADEELSFSSGAELFASRQELSNTLASNSTMGFLTENVPGLVEPEWGLLDIQPTLDWLDADFSYFDGNH